MKKKKEVISQNYLEKIPIRPPHIEWSADENGIVTLDIVNTGLFNRVAQKLFRKPRVSHIHLDEMGSFVWPLLDGEKDPLVLYQELVDIDSNVSKGFLLNKSVLLKREENESKS